ncbi:MULTISPECIES: DUF429 domain-containing protein [unclassified Hydrogenophaga]|uniref:DUF429 domain-containing protein n=1 Tax=unclassified Hydrogenophaga TaxID=2610897 RepID=UPI001320014D|nr:DUF429 domain-containing protein [Hydrogenophaga sp. PBL-H3]QHE78545.1 DUF429 domain-containing protein [Hydrogenophaga sp. PBL-H3]QHE82970.1 DUF429 domain-containing protein [Hydrogenophaga sp. PBL-H3]
MHFNHSKAAVLVVGLDPGGNNAFGWVIAAGTFAAPRFLSGGVCSSAQAAITEVQNNLTCEMAAVGIDAPLFWSSSGDRRADVHVRRLVCAAGGQAGTVGHVNSLQGACLVQGAIAARLVNEKWPAAAITEAHPKALLRVCSDVHEFAAIQDLQGEGHHIRDAGLGAISALAMIEKRASWQDLAATEPEPLYPLGVQVAYWFPRRADPSR